MPDLAKVIQREEENFSEHIDNHLKQAGMSSSDLTLITNTEPIQGTLYVFEEGGLKCYSIESSKLNLDGSVTVEKGWISRKKYIDDVNLGKTCNLYGTKRVGNDSHKLTHEEITIPFEKFETGSVYLLR